jgi:hypothetical protein
MTRTAKRNVYFKFYKALRKVELILSYLIHHIGKALLG